MPPTLDRRSVLGLAAGAAAAPALAEPADPTEVVRLWPDRPPGAPATLPTEKITDRIKTTGWQDRFVTGVATPLMTVFRPERANGAAMLVIPGGGYIRVVIDKEGFEAARALAAAGVTAFVLCYRLPEDGWTPKVDAPLQDAQRALRLIRAGADRYGIDPGRVGVMGFSAGGHLAASLCTRPEALIYPALDAADRLPARPDRAALCYPVLSLAPPLWHRGSADALLGPDAPAALRNAYSPQLHVGAAAPPTFLAHAADDASVPVENSLAYLAALRAARVPAELHVFQEGGHGFGLRGARGKPAAAWMDLFLAWADRAGFFRPR
ncbi:MAG: alpha/beta hydrolase [Phenylobacterium sp.]